MNDAAIGCISDTPLGPLWLAATEIGLLAVQIRGDAAALANTVRDLTGRSVISNESALGPAADQLVAYLNGRRQAFDLPLDWSPLATFQRQVLALVLRIPFGQWWTYGQIAADLGQPGAARAVGAAVGANPLPIVIPCHRVLAARGRLGGYSGAGGLETKAFLLRLEGGLLL